jgi:hypothetical protein
VVVVAGMVVVVVGMVVVVVVVGAVVVVVGAVVVVVVWPVVVVVLLPTLAPAGAARAVTGHTRPTSIAGTVHRTNRRAVNTILPFPSRTLSPGATRNVPRVRADRQERRSRATSLAMMSRG